MIPYNPEEAAANREDVSINIVEDGDDDNAATFNAVFQPMLDLFQRVKKKAGFLDLASTWTTLQTFAGGIAGTTAALTGAITGASVNVGSGAISGGAVSGSTGTFTGAVSGASGAFAGPVSGTAGTFTGAVSGTGGTLTDVTLAGSITAGTWISSGGGAGFTYATGWQNGFAPALQVRVLPWGVLQFQGSASAQSGSGTLVLTLPATHRVAVDRKAYALTTGGPVNVDINSDGTVVLVSPVAVGTIVNFDSVAVCL